MSSVDWSQVDQWFAEHDPQGRTLFQSARDTLTMIGWAEQEIARAQGEHPAEVADLLYHSVMLVQPQPLRGMRTEMVFRGHARELLARVASGADTRPGTAAEVCCVLLEAASRAPLTTTAMGLLFRMWAVAFPEVAMPGGDQGVHYEAIRASDIDDAEADARRGLAVADRRIQTAKKQILCAGRHNGVPVACRFAQPVTTFYQPE